MQVHVNGEQHDLDQGTTLKGLLQQLDISADRIAVEINLEIVQRQDFDSRELHEGDRIEIISFIGGGIQE